MFWWKYRIEVEKLRVEVLSAEKLRESVVGLYERLLEDKNRLLEENISLRSKIDLMEVVLMPLSSAAGALYQNQLHPPDKPNFQHILESTPTSWQQYREQKNRELQDSYASED